MDDLLREVIDIFVAEVREQADRVAQALLTMEQQPSLIPAEIEELYRQAHSLKGSSASLGVDELAQLAHQFEAALLPVRRLKIPLTREMVDLGLKAMDAAKLRVVGLQADNDVGLAQVHELAEKLEQLAAHHEIAAEPAPGRAAEKEVFAPEVQPTTQADQETGAAQVSVPVFATESPDTVRVQVEKLARLIHRTDDLRRLRGQLERHHNEVALLVRACEKLKQHLGGTTRQIGEEFAHVMRGLRALRRDLFDDLESLQVTTTEMDDGLRAMQLVPASMLQQTLSRAVREACRSTGKEASLNIVGEEVRLDRTLTESIKAPLVHLVRNAVDHGLEDVSIREAIGKTAVGNVTLSFVQRGSQIEISVSDDGRGLDGAQIRQTAVARGFLSETQCAALTEDETYSLLLRPGFTTRDHITELSGRGVGLDVVNTAVQKLHGTLQVFSSPGQGCSFVVTVPLTVAASRVLLIEEQDHIFALPLPAIHRIALPSAEELTQIADQTVFYMNGQPHTVVSLSQLLGQTHTGEARMRKPLLLLRGASGVAIACDKLRGENDLVLRPLPVELRQLNLLSSVATVPSGPVLFVLSPQGLAQTAMKLRFFQGSQGRRKTVLVADDSITTRSLLRSVLESGGYRVRTAAAGDEA